MDVQVHVFVYKKRDGLLLRVTVLSVNASCRVLVEREELGDVLLEAVLKDRPLHLLTVEEVEVGAEKVAFQVY